jgi:hypothetical protein
MVPEARGEALERFSSSKAWVGRLQPVLMHQRRHRGALQAHRRATSVSR